MTPRQKLWNRPLGNLAGRALQLLRARLESWGFRWTGTGLPRLGKLVESPADDLQAWLTEFRTGSWPVPFSSLEAPSDSAAAVQRRWPQAAKKTIRSSERNLEGRFDLLGYEDLSFGRPVDWHLDPVAGKRAPRRHWSRISYLDADAVGDHKVIWELNRHQWFVTLGRAYRLSADERFAEGFVDYLSHWMDENPPGEGINWASSLEVGMRAVAWIWSLHLFRSSPSLTPELFRRTLRFLTAHGRHIEAYLSTWFSPNTHLTGEALSLVYLGTLLPRLPGSERWRETGLRVLTSELDRQTHPDGVYFEHSTWYHRYTADFYVHLLVLARRHGLDGHEAIEDRLEKVLDHLAWLVRPDGTAPRVGDDDGGRLLFLDTRPAADFRSTLATGAALYGREDWAYIAGEPSEETLWLLGRDGLEAFDSLEPSPPDTMSRSFPEGGFYASRDGWENHSSSLLIRCGSPGRSTAHAHADALSFDLTVRGTPVLVDPGTGSYMDVALRNRLRGTAAHNALTLGGKPSSVPDEAPFSWSTRARCEVEAWHAAGTFAFLRGRHDGFRRQGIAGDHVRSLLDLKGDGWIIRDRIEDRGSKPPVLHLQFAPGTRLRASPSGLDAVTDAGVEQEEEGVVLRVRCFDVESVDTFAGTVSPEYGKLVSAPAARLVAAERPEQDVVTFLLPGETRIESLQACTGGRAWVIHRIESAIEDLFVLAESPGTPSLEHLSSDFSWAWIRRDAADGSLREAVLLDGTWMRWNGHDVLRTEAGRLPWVGFRVERDRDVRVEAPRNTRFRLQLPGRQPLLVHGPLPGVENGIRV